MSPQQTELIEQFILEARECLETIGQRLLEVERAPDDRALLDDLFRQVHTLKGNCGLFDFKPLELVVHAGEDLLDRVRNGTLAYGDEMADALLEAMDYSAQLIDAIAADGCLPPEAPARSREVAAALRGLLADDDASAGARAAGGTEGLRLLAAAPEWLARLPAAARHAALVLRYRPEPECFFKGEDPWHLACTTPGLVHLAVAAADPWPAADVFDCYRCNLELLIASDAPRAQLDEHFRYVPEQLEAYATGGAAGEPGGDVPCEAAGEAACDVPGEAADPAEALVREQAARLWAEQLQVLARPVVAEGTVAAVRVVLGRLLRAVGAEAAVEAALRSLPPAEAGAAALAAWAQAQAQAPARGLALAGAPCPTDEAASGAAAGAAAGGAAAASAGRGPGPGVGSIAGEAAPGSEGRVAPGLGVAPGGAEPGGERTPRVVKVAQDKIDRLMELIGEMVVAKNALPYLATRAEAVFGQRELSREVKAQYAVINRIAEEMQHAIMQVRMLPVGTVLQRFPRLVRDLGRKLGKDVRLVMEGEDTEADKNIVETLADPLIHIVRNSLDHGLETPEERIEAGKSAHGTLRISARQDSDRVVLEIADDGAGIDTERVRRKAVERGLLAEERAATMSDAEAAQLVFLPGFSTVEAISDLSGRGVGMDVVRSAVERVNGSVELATARGAGTTIRLSLPLSMAVTNVMMIEAGGRHFGVPMDLIVETVRVAARDIHRFKQAQTTVLRGRIVPLRALHELLELDAEPRPNAGGEHAVLVVRIGNEPIGLLVDDFHGTSDIILKPLEGVLAGLTGFAGTALMGDGSVLMILNPKELT